jgi:L-lactate dehydrogenase (cytochrome)
VLLGRAWVYALGGSGEAGVEHMLNLIAEEMRVALALTGCTRVRDISRELLAEAA